MTAGEFVALVWILFALAMIWQSILSWLMFSVVFKEEFARIYRFNSKVFIVIPVVIAVILGHIYFFIPSSRTGIDKITYYIGVGFDRVIYKLAYDDPDGKYYKTFARMPVYVENYDLTIPNEVCAYEVIGAGEITYEVVQERCQSIPWTLSIFQTYLAADVNGDLLYHIKEARPIHQRLVHNEL